MGPHCGGAFGKRRGWWQGGWSHPELNSSGSGTEDTEEGENSRDIYEVDR